MLCCVIGSALAALLIAKLSRLPLVGPLFGRLTPRLEDPSDWRLDARGAPR
ncbi:MAG: hypothetical protein ACU85U_11830 [Gammaproteobacteria bacterium]|jgi:hypothetical protein